MFLPVLVPYHGLWKPSGNMELTSSEPPTVIFLKKLSVAKRVNKSSHPLGLRFCNPQLTIGSSWRNCGEMSERPKERAWKARVRVIPVPWVRIPPSPPFSRPTNSYPPPLWRAGPKGSPSRGIPDLSFWLFSSTMIETQSQHLSSSAYSLTCPSPR